MTPPKGRPQQRLFIAVDPPARVRDEVSAWARYLCRFTEGLRPVPAVNTHITLAFLGDRDPAEIPILTELLIETAAPVSGLALGAPIWLPKRRPRTLSLEIHDDRDELATVRSGMAKALADLIGWTARRPFRAHLTAARTGRGFDPAGRHLPVSPSLTFEAAAITLYASILRPEGARYEALERIDFD